MTGKPIYNAIVWQDTRGPTGSHEPARRRAGSPARQDRPAARDVLLGPKAAWILDNVDGAREKAEAGDLMFGNIDTWCI